MSQRLDSPRTIGPNAFAKWQSIKQVISATCVPRLLLVATLGVGLVAPLLHGCAARSPDILRMVVDAKTPDDHEAIASYYEKQAAKNEAEASFHRRLAETYRRFHNTYKNDMAPHCEIVADNYMKIAAEDSELAKEHRKLAQGGK
jgi:hypothetical protein